MTHDKYPVASVGGAPTERKALRCVLGKRLNREVVGDAPTTVPWSIFYPFQPLLITNPEVLFLRPVS